MDWRTFFSDIFSHDSHEEVRRAAPPPPETKPKPGAVMICFVNRYLEALDGVKYKILFDGKKIEGETTSTSYCFKLQPETLGPIRVFVWSRRTKNFKALNNVIPLPGKSQLIRKILASAKVQTRTEKHPETLPPNPPPKKLPPPTPPGPSPVKDQGVIPTPTHNERAEPQTQASRPVPGMITLVQLRKIFTDSRAASDAYLQSVADELNRDLPLYKLDTPLRRAHFFAQVKGETGNGMKPKREVWEYSPETLKKFSKYYRAHPDEAIADGYLKDKAKKKIIRHTNEEAVGRKHFATLNGNRTKTHPEDGSNFRGRGLLQLTGYTKYSEFKKQYSNLWPGPVPDSVNDPEIIVKFPYSVRSAVWFWLYREAYKVADCGATEAVVETLSYLINGGNMGLEERKEAFIVSYPAFK